MGISTTPQPAGGSGGGAGGKSSKAGSGPTAAPPAGGRQTAARPGAPLNTEINTAEPQTKNVPPPVLSVSQQKYVYDLLNRSAGGGVVGAPQQQLDVDAVNAAAVASDNINNTFPHPYQGTGIGTFPHVFNRWTYDFAVFDAKHHNVAATAANPSDHKSSPFPNANNNTAATAPAPGVGVGSSAGDAGPAVGDATLWISQAIEKIKQHTAQQKEATAAAADQQQKAAAAAQGGNDNAATAAATGQGETPTSPVQVQGKRVGGQRKKSVVTITTENETSAGGSDGTAGTNINDANSSPTTLALRINQASAVVQQQHAMLAQFAQNVVRTSKKCFQTLKNIYENDTSLVHPPPPSFSLLLEDNFFRCASTAPLNISRGSCHLLASDNVKRSSQQHQQQQQQSHTNNNNPKPQSLEVNTASPQSKGKRFKNAFGASTVTAPAAVQQGAANDVGNDSFDNSRSVDTSYLLLQPQSIPTSFVGGTSTTPAATSSSTTTILSKPIVSLSDDVWYKLIFLREKRIRNAALLAHYRNISTKCAARLDNLQRCHFVCRYSIEAATVAACVPHRTDTPSSPTVAV